MLLSRMIRLLSSSNSSHADLVEAIQMMIKAAGNPEDSQMAQAALRRAISNVVSRSIQTAAEQNQPLSCNESASEINTSGISSICAEMKDLQSQLHEEKHRLIDSHKKMNEVMEKNDKLVAKEESMERLYNDSEVEVAKLWRSLHRAKKNETALQHTV